MSHTVFANNRSLSHEGSGDTSICSAPDVCKTPMGPATPPLPYPITSQAADSGSYSTSVFIDGNATALEGSNHTACAGDEAGTATGIISGLIGDITEFISYSFDVKAEGQGMVRHMDTTTMNAGNTMGMIMGVTAVSAAATEEEIPDPVPKTLIIRIGVTATHVAEEGDTMTLSSECGSYSETKTISDDLIDNEDHIEFIFEELDANLYYRLEHHDASTGQDYLYFENKHFVALKILSPKKTINSGA